VDTEGKLGEAGAGPVADLLPNSLLIHVHIAYFFRPVGAGLV
jgi:hypothetical protein